MAVAAYVYLSTVFLLLFGLGIILRISCKEEKTARRRRRNGNPQSHTDESSVSRTVEFIDCSQQEQNVYNISGRVPSNTTQYPDAYLSAEHISVTNELNKPPKYDDAPPSYEEALKLAIAQSNSLQTLQFEQTQTHQGQSSTSGSTSVTVPVHVASCRTTD